MNHNPSKGVQNISKMYQAIGTEQIQVNTIRVKFSMEPQPGSGIAEIDKSSQLGNEQENSERESSNEADMKSITIYNIPMGEASSQ